MDLTEYDNFGSLKFDETPDYKKICMMLTQALSRITPASKHTLNIDLLGEDGMSQMANFKISKKPSFTNIVDVSCSDNSFSKRTANLIEEVACTQNCRI